MSNPSEKLISVSAALADELDEICVESECDINTVLTYMIAALDDKDGAIIRIYHAHHEPKDDDELPTEPLPYNECDENEDPSS